MAFGGFYPPSVIDTWLLPLCCDDYCHLNEKCASSSSWIQLLSRWKGAGLEKGNSQPLIASIYSASRHDMPLVSARNVKGTSPLRFRRQRWYSSLGYVPFDKGIRHFSKLTLYYLFTANLPNGNQWSVHYRLLSKNNARENWLHKISMVSIREHQLFVGRFESAKSSKSTV
jgi:hypothetical protein